MKVCARCKIKKELEDYYKNNQSKTGLSSYCKECQKSDKKNHYQNNKEQYAKNHFYNKKWLVDIKLELKCEKCGFDHPAALDFHHLNPNEKKFLINNNGVSKRSKEEIENEIKKCIILCSNCHRIEHAIHYNKYLK